MHHLGDGHALKHSLIRPQKLKRMSENCGPESAIYPAFFHSGTRPPRVGVQDQALGSRRGDGTGEARPARADARVHRGPAGGLPAGGRARGGPADGGRAAEDRTPRVGEHQGAGGGRSRARQAAGGAVRGAVGAAGLFGIRYSQQVVSAARQGGAEEAGEEVVHERAEETAVW